MVELVFAKNAGQGIPITIYDNATLPIKYYAFDQPGLIDDNTIFLKLGTRDLLFFATGRDLYWYHLSTGTTRLFKRFDSPVTAITQSPRETSLAVGLADGSFLVHGIVDQQLPDPPLLFRADGMGRVVDILYKQENYLSWTARLE
jgi:hypothetical protein